MIGEVLGVGLVQGLLLFEQLFIIIITIVIVVIKFVPPIVNILLSITLCMLIII